MSNRPHRRFHHNSQNRNFVPGGSNYVGAPPINAQHHGMHPNAYHNAPYPQPVSQYGHGGYINQQQGGLFPAYAPQPAGFQCESFESRADGFKAALEAKLQREALEKARRENRELKTLLEENQPEGRIRITLTDDDEDDDDTNFMIVASAPADPAPEPSTSKKYRKHKGSKRRHRSSSRKRRHRSRSGSRKRHRHRHDRKKRHGRKRRSTSASSSSTSTEENSGGRHSRRDHKRDHERRKRRRRSTSSSTSSSSSSSSSSTVSDRARNRKSKRQAAPASPQRPIRSPSPIISFLDARKNPWELLKPRDYRYRATHVVVDPRGDNENLMFEHPYMKQITEFYSLPRALTAQMQAITLKEADAEEVVSERYFSPQIAKFFRKGRANERRFRRKAPIGYGALEVVPLSHLPCGSDEEADCGMKKEEVTEEELRNMDINDYEARQAAIQLSSYEEANLDGKQKILRSKCTKHSSDIDAWIKFARLQKPIMAKQECGNPDAEVINKRALFDRQHEILLQAAKANPANVELALEKLKLEEEFYGVDSRDVLDGWKNLENRFVNSLKMWQMNIKMKESNRTTFELSKIINLIDKCLLNLVDIKDGVKLSHRFLDGTEEFLVDMIVHRCKLQLEADFTDRVVCALQALTEFHFFAPSGDVKLKVKASKSRVLVESLRTFWDIGVPRIGDEGALGWKNSDFTLDTSTEEAQFLRSQIQDIQRRETELLNGFQNRRPTNIDTWRQVEKFRVEQYWRPIRFATHPSEIYEYSSRMVQFNDLSKMIFEFIDKKLASNLIFRIAQLLGAVIPGMPEQSQSDILHQFSEGSTNLFPKMDHNLRDIDKFLDSFFDLLAKADGIDAIRIHCAKLTTRVKYLQLSSLTQKEKNKRMAEWMSEFYQSKESTLNKAIYFFHHAKCYEKINNPQKGLNEALLILRGLQKSLWSADLSTMEKNTYCEILRWVCRRLPFTDAELKSEDTDTIPSSACFEPKTKYELLFAFGVNGTMKRVPNTEENKAEASRIWKGVLTLREGVSVSPNNDHSSSWFCNENEALLELASIYYYERSSHHLSSFAIIFPPSPKPAPLAKKVGMTEAIYETKLDVYAHKMCTSTKVTPRDMKKLMLEAMEAHPTNISFLKRFVDICRPCDARFFLQMNEGGEGLPRRVRACASVYLEWRYYVKVMETADELQKEHSFNALRHVLEKAAQTLTDSSDLPDAYVWSLLMHIEQENCSPIRRIDELFALAQKQCPWSKRLLYETAWKRVDSDGFQTTLTGVISACGLQQYCQLEEVPLLYEPDIQNEDDDDEEYLEDEEEDDKISQAIELNGSANNAQRLASANSVASAGSRDPAPSSSSVVAVHQKEKTTSNVRENGSSSQNSAGPSRAIVREIKEEPATDNSPVRPQVARARKSIPSTSVETKAE